MTQLSCLADAIATQALRVCLSLTRSFWFVTFVWSQNNRRAVIDGRQL